MENLLNDKHTVTCNKIFDTELKRCNMTKVPSQQQLSSSSKVDSSEQ